MSEAKWTRRDIPKLVGIVIVLSLVAGTTVPTISFNLGIVFGSDLNRILGQIAVGGVALVVVLWTASRFHKVSLTRALLITVAVAVVTATSIFLFILG